VKTSTVQVRAEQSRAEQRKCRQVRTRAVQKRATQCSGPQDISAVSLYCVERLRVGQFMARPHSAHTKTAVGVSDTCVLQCRNGE
jgi:hypothetical protein